MEHHAVLETPGLTDWEAVYSCTGIFEEGCWTSGCDAQCCHYEKVGKNFTLIKKVNEIPLFPGEYHYLKTHNKFQAGSTTKILTLTLTNGINIPVILNWCPLRGRCSVHDDRPVMCRLYPYFPVIDNTGRIESFERSIPYDWFWEDLGEPMPCTLTSLSLESLNSLFKINTLLVADSNNIFYMRIAHLYKHHIYRHLHANKLVSSYSDADGFFAQWEKLLISNKLFCAAALLNEITELWEECKRLYGDQFTVGKT